MITVYGRATSSNVQKVMWTIGELELPVSRIDLGGRFGGLDTAEFRAINPHGRIPGVVLENGVRMFESNVIMRTLARNDPDRRLWPTEPQLEADAEAWSEWAQQGVVYHVTRLFWTSFRTHKDLQKPDVIAGHLVDAVKGMEIVEEHLADRQFLVADHLTIADIVFAHSLYRYFSLPVERPHLPNIAAYYARISERPAYAEHVMVDYSELAGAR
ncbi:MAG: glutathione S-transferase family protein [Pseudomonadota bacterium]